MDNLVICLLNEKRGSPSELNSTNKLKYSCNQILILLYSLYYAEVCNELAGPISVALRPRSTAPFKEMSQQWPAVGNTESDLTGPRFKPQTSRFRHEGVTARPTGR